MRLKYVTREEEETRDEAGFRLDKKAVACGHLDAAIDMLFSQRSAASVHVLAWAASDIIRGVAQAKGTRILEDDLEERIYPERLKEWRAISRRDYNFMKHADRDPESDVDEYKPASTWTRLFLAVVAYQQVFGLMTFQMVFFFSWFSNRYSHWLKPGPLADQVELVKASMVSQRPVSAAGEPYRTLIEQGFHLDTRFHRRARA